MRRSAPGWRSRSAGREPFDTLWFNVAGASLAGADNGGGALKPVQDGDPEHIGPYRVIGLLGAGGMGRVYLGHRDDGVTAAVKVINEELAQDAAFRERFRREVLATKAVTGRHVAAVIDYDVESEQPWLATEYVPAPSLHTVIVKRGPLDAASVRSTGAHLAEALAAIHAAGLVHRDVKPGNILLSGEGPRLIDFGIARGTAVTTLTQTGAVLGTPQYMAPEQLRGRSRVGPAADVFALGLVLAFAVTGEHPFGQDDSYGIGFRIVYEEPQLDLVPDDLARIIRHCLAKQPEDRPTPEELAAALREEAGSCLGPVPATRPEPLPEGGAAAEEEQKRDEEDKAPSDAGAVVAVVTDPADPVAPLAPAAPANPPGPAAPAGGDVPAAGGETRDGTTVRPRLLPAGHEGGHEPERGPRRRILAASAAAGAVALVVLLAVTLDDGGNHAAAQSPGSQGTPRSSASTGSTPTATGGTTSGSSGSPAPSRPSASSGGSPGRSAGATPPGGTTGGANPGSSAGTNGGTNSGTNGGANNGSAGGTAGSSGGSSNGSTSGGAPGSSTPTHGSAPTHSAPTTPAAGRPPGNMTGFNALYNESCFGACSMPLTVSWSAESGATGYDIHYTDSNGNVNTVYSTGGTSYVIDGPYSGDDICVSVRAANAYGASAWTPSYCGTTPY